MKRVIRSMKQLGWKRWGLGVLIALPVVMIVAQFIYPFGATMPGVVMQGVAIGGMSREDAEQRVEDAFADRKLAVYFGEADEPYRSPKLAELGVAAASDEAVGRAMYPWWLRLVPTSVWWGHATVGDEPIAAELQKTRVDEYVTRELGESCVVEPKNASIAIEEGVLKVVEAEDGGRCEVDEVVVTIAAVAPSLVEKNTVRIAMERIAPEVTSEDAGELANSITARLKGGVTLALGDTAKKLSEGAVASWLVFDVKDGELAARVDVAKAKETLEKEVGPLVAQKAGVVTITTRDFVELSRSGGPDGRRINVEGTSEAIGAYVRGESDQAVIATSVVPAEKKYIRSYSPTDVGLSALIKHYAESHTGTFGVSLIELSGERRRASFNGDKQFTTASTYKSYVAYSTLKRVEGGSMKWSDEIVGGRNLAKCFDDMIVLSDNPCAETLVKKIGYNALHADVQALGLKGTSFIDKESFKTTAGDLSTFMASLEANQLPISKSSRDRLVGAMKRNVHRQGIPAGASGSVADKVGFLNGLLHDMAIVYSPKGTYVLSVMTDKSSWAAIADLTREIEKLRAQ